MRAGIDPPSTTFPGAFLATFLTWKFADTCAPVRDGLQHKSDRSPAGMIETLKQAGMLVVLVLLSEGLFVLGGASRNGDTHRSKPTATMEFVAGIVLCSSAVILLYSLGTRDEK